MNTDLPASSALRRYGSLLLLFVVFLAYAAFKWSDLGLPLFWDELGVFGPGILYMVDHGIGIMPADLPPELSRGHPLLFYFLQALWIKVWGYSLFKLHLLPLLFTLGLSGLTYAIGVKILGKWPALFAAALFLVLPNILAMGVMALPEIPMALFSILGLWFFGKKSFPAYFLAAAAALMIKEPAVVLIAASAAYALIFSKDKCKEILWALAPLSVYVVFLIIQKGQNGWFFFPYHIGFISFEWDTILHKANLFAEAMVKDRGKWMLLATIALGAVLFLQKGLKEKRWNISPFFLLSFLFIGMQMGFSLSNFYMDRYLVVIFPLLCLLAAWTLQLLGEWGRNGTIAAVVLGILILSSQFYLRSRPEFRYDQDLNYRELVRIQVEGTHALEAALKPGEPFTCNWPLFSGLADPRMGYRSSSDKLDPYLHWQDNLRIAILMEPGVPIEVPRERSIEHQVFEGKTGKVELFFFKPSSPADSSAQSLDTLRSSSPESD